MKLQTFGTALFLFPFVLLLRLISQFWLPTAEFQGGNSNMAGWCSSTDIVCLGIKRDSFINIDLNFQSDDLL